LNTIGVVCGDGERDIGPVWRPSFAIIFVPGLVDGDFGFVFPGGDGVGQVGEGAVAVGVLEPGAQAGGHPIFGATDGGLEAAGHVGDEVVDAVGDPAGVVVKVEGDGGFFGQGEGDVGAAGFGVEAKVDVPGVVEGGFVFVIASRNGENGRPQLIFFVEGQVGGSQSGASRRGSRARSGWFRGW
jgi:hypothetical protein